MDKKRATRLSQRVVVPMVLAISIAGTVAAIATAAGCGEDKPRLDAGRGDGGIDSPVV